MKKELLLKKEINLFFLDILKGVTEISVFNLRKTFYDKYDEQRKEFVSIQNKKNKISLLGDNIYGFSVTLLMAIALFKMAPLVYSGNLQGVYYAMIPLAIMASFEGIMPMPMIFYKNSEAFNAGKSIFSIIGEKVHKEFKNKEILSPDIYIKNMYVREPGSNEYILQDISFELPRGKKVAIVGSSGSGKSTLLKILLGFMKYTEGNIKIGNMELSSIDIEEVRKLFTYVEQNPYVFNASIKENLMISSDGDNVDIIMKALKAAKIKNLIDEMPKGMNSLIGQFGSKISGGEKQRLAIARAFLKPSPIVLLDEPTASLDVELEKDIIREIHKFTEGKSCIWVTHRLVSMEKMDEILLINEGKILERGTHKQLLELKGSYYKLWKIQQQFVGDSFN
jgi:ATP-binding cassette subfamily C protein CydC